MKKALLAAILAAFPVMGAAQPVCHPAQIMVMVLQVRYSEKMVDARDVDGIQHALWANVEHGTWTYTRQAAGMVCAMSWGKGAKTLEDAMKEILGQAL